jgi:hypothetical protein
MRHRPSMMPPPPSLLLLLLQIVRRARERESHTAHTLILSFMSFMTSR